MKTRAKYVLSEICFVFIGFFFPFAFHAIAISLTWLMFPLSVLSVDYVHSARLVNKKIRHLPERYCKANTHCMYYAWCCWLHVSTAVPNSTGGEREGKKIPEKFLLAFIVSNTIILTNEKLHHKLMNGKKLMWGERSNLRTISLRLK